MSVLFSSGQFQLHSGGSSRWKIDCDALTEEDIRTLAMIIADRMQPWSAIEGVPQGGLRLARALETLYPVGNGPPLIVDDVLTTGASMEAQRAGRKDIKGVVIFARGSCPSWVSALFTLWPTVT